MQPLVRARTRHCGLRVTHADGMLIQHKSGAAAAISACAHNLCGLSVTHAACMLSLAPCLVLLQPLVRARTRQGGLRVTHAACMLS